jgi:hypothetical protein
MRNLAAGQPHGPWRSERRRNAPSVTARNSPLEVGARQTDRRGEYRSLARACGIALTVKPAGAGHRGCGARSRATPTRRRCRWCARRSPVPPAVRGRARRNGHPTRRPGASQSDGASDTMRSRFQAPPGQLVARSRPGQTSSANFVLRRKAIASEVGQMRVNLDFCRH